ncbi:MAG: DUF5131 family protein [Flavobacteriales bacterium]|nr:DUF5131 family protein [Flavobacteriales bacterium]
MKRTSIEWTDFSANPIKYRDADGRVAWGCVKASAGCQNCYAEAISKRFRGPGAGFTAKRMEGLAPYVDEDELKAMLSPRRLPAGSKVFVGDMTDIFGPWVPFDMLDRLFDLFALRQDVTFQVLTKRPERMREYLTVGVSPMDPRWRAIQTRPIWPGWPLPNVWLGTSAEDQAAADRRIPELLACPAAVRFVSCEPMLGPVDLCTLNVSPAKHSLQSEVWKYIDALTGATTFYVHGERKESVGTKLDWVIFGGESGPGARPCDIGWIRSIVGQCKAAGVPAFVKQLGSRPVSLAEQDDDWPRTGPANTVLALKSRKGGEMSEWPEDLRVREMPR